MSYVYHKTDNNKLGAKLLFEGEDYSVYMINEKEGKVIPNHMHRNWDESWFIVDGLYSITIENKSIFAYSGDFIAVERGTKHAIRCASEKATRLAIFKKGVEIHYEN